MTFNVQKPANESGLEFGLVANGSAGYWDVDLDESLDGAQRWFLQIDGPPLYLHFQIEHPTIVDALIGFLDQAVCGSASAGHDVSCEGDELELSRAATNRVAFLRDRNTNGCSIVSVTGPDEFSARFMLERNDVENVRMAFHQVREELVERGLIPVVYCESNADRSHTEAT